MKYQEDSQSDFIEKMISLRRKKKLTQTELSIISGVSQPVIARLEKSKTDPQLSTVIKLLHSMGAGLTINE
jgi:predicted transcriptional regulator